MLETKFILQNTNEVLDSLRKRNRSDLFPVVEKIQGLDHQRKEAIQKVESLKAERNQASLKVAQAKKEGKEDPGLFVGMKRASQEIKELDSALEKIQTGLQTLLFELPNQLAPSVPAGKSSDENKLIRSWGKPKELSFAPKSHDEIGEALGILDFKKAGEVTGARFCFMKGEAARLERALIQFMLDLQVKNGYEEMAPPLLVNRNALTGTGQLPKFEEDVFQIEKFGFFLIPTAEVPVTNYHRDEILEEGLLPRSYVAFTPCFRSEAGSYGKDTKGLKRQHQFNKVELVKITTPESSQDEHEKLTAHAEMVLQKLELPYRVMLLCGGDTGFSSQKTYDLEVYSPYLKGYMEISSCSNFGDFQARRAGIRYRSTETGKVHFCHTLNGSGLAVGRTLLAILENYQTESGSFEIPAALKPYMESRV